MISNEPPKRRYAVSAKRVARRDSRRAELLDAAMALTVEGGLDALTIAGLAARVGASVGALYRYFPSKEAILIGLQELAVADYHGFARERLAAFERARAPAPADIVALARVMVVLRSYLEHATASPERHRLVDAVVSDPEPLLDLERAMDVNLRIVTPIVTAIAELFEAAVRDGALAGGDAVERTYVAWAMQHGLDHFRKRDRLVPAHLQTPTLQTFALRMLLAGLGASQTALEAAERLVVAGPESAGRSVATR